MSAISFSSAFFSLSQQNSCSRDKETLAGQDCFIAATQVNACLMETGLFLESVCSLTALLSVNMDSGFGSKSVQLDFINQWALFSRQSIVGCVCDRNFGSEKFTHNT